MTQSELRTFFDSKTDDMIQLTREWCEIESPTPDKAAVDRMGARLQADLKALGAEITVYPRTEAGDHIEATWNADAPGRPMLFICHMDTVHPIGELERNPIRIEDGRMYGPGGYDMKACIVTAYTAIKGLLERDEMPDRPVRMLITSDEETGSRHSADLIKEVAEGCAFAMIMEPATEDGSVKTWRKAAGAYEFFITGKPAHAGVEPEKGVSAIEEMANLTVKLQAMNDLRVGTTVSVGVIKGGTVSNVIPEHCYARVDVRAMTTDEMDRISAQIEALKPTLIGTAVEITGGFQRPPMERNDLMLETYGTASGIAANHGIELRETGTGGGSDGNFTAAIGVPTLDGLGPAGAGAHTSWEHIQVGTLGRTAAMLAAFLIEWPE